MASVTELAAVHGGRAGRSSKLAGAKAQAQDGYQPVAQAYTVLRVDILLVLLLGVVLASQAWLGFMLWRMDKFLIVLAVGANNLAAYEGSLGRLDGPNDPRFVEKTQRFHKTSTPQKLYNSGERQNGRNSPGN